LNQPGAQAAETADSVVNDVVEEGTPAAHTEDAVATRARMRRALLAASIQQRREAADANLLARSEIVRGIRSHGESTMRTGNCCLRVAGTLGLGLGALLGVVWIPVTACFWVFSALYPFLNAYRCGPSAHPELAAGTDLACTLTAVQAVGILAMIGMLPSVRRWQTLRMDLIGLDGFPQCFYGDEVLAEMVRRAHFSLEQRAVAQTSDRRSIRRRQEQQHIANGHTCENNTSDTHCSICLDALHLGDSTGPVGAKHNQIASHSNGGQNASECKLVVALPMCMHAFHKECIYEWLGANRSCPNCRADVAQAAPADI